MNCPREFRLAVYADGELPGSDSAEVAAHLDVCATCKARVLSFQEENRWLTASLRGLDSDPEFVPAPLMAPRRLAASLDMWPLTTAVGGAASVLALILNNVFRLEMPAGFGWLDPAGVYGRLTLLARVVFYLIEGAVPMVESIVTSVSYALLGLLFLSGAALILRRTARRTQAAMTAGLLLLMAVPVHAIDIRSVENGTLTIAAGEIVDDTLVVFAQSINIDGTVTGGVIAFGMEINVSGSVEGNLVGFARRINVAGAVGGDVLGFAQTVTTTGRIAGDLWAFNESAIVDEDGRVDGNVTLFAADGGIDGGVGRDLTMFGALLDVGGDVGRGVNFRGDQLFIRAPATVGGNVSAIVGSEERVQIDPAAMISGTRSIELRAAPTPRFATVSFYVSQVLRLIAAFVAGLLLFWVLPGLGRVDLGDTRVLLTSGGIGFLALVATPVAVLVLAITLIGLPLAFLTGAAWLLALYLSKIMVAQFLGSALIGRKPNGVATAPGLFVGLVAVILSVNLPVVGGLVNILLVLVGLGALVLGLYRMIQGPGPQTATPQAA